MTVPALPLVVPRNARAAEIAACLEGLAFTALLAPPGYGKTTLLGLACERVRAPAVRYTVELWHAGDFVEPLVEVLARERADFGRRTLALARRKPRDLEALPTWGRQLGATFALDLDHIREPIVIAIDDAHLLAEDPVFANFIVGALKALPPHAHLVLLGRTLPDMPIAEWIAAGRARVFAVDDIRFDAGDVRQLAEKLGHPVGESELATVVSLYEGWAAGIALAFAAGDAAVPARGGSLPARYAYLLDANLDALHDDLVRFLEQTAVFETLDAPLLESEPGFERSRGHLAELERRGIMLEVIRPGASYRVHPLLREALVERARRRGPREIPGAHLRAANALERAGRIREALYHFEACDDGAALARFIGAHAYETFIAGLGERIARIAKRLERNGSGAVATFALIEGMIARQRGEPGAEDAFVRGIAAAGVTDRVGIACRMLLIEDRLARREPVATELFAELSAAARVGGPLVELNVHVFSGWSRAIAGDFEEARAHARRATAIAGDEIVGRTRAASLEAYAATALGAFAEADALMAATLRALEASEHVVLFANTLVWYARLSLLWNDVAAARDYAERGRTLALELDLPAELAGVDLALAEVFARLGDRGRCEAACKSAVRGSAAAWYAGDRKRSRALATIFQARGAFAANDVAHALASARTAFDDATVPMPGAQRAALAADIAAYAVLASDRHRAQASERAASLLRAATADDAVDAAHLSDAATILATIATRGDVSLAIEPSAAVRAIYGGFIAARRAVAATNPIVLALGPALRSSAIDKAPRSSQLTPREDEILRLIAQGLTNREIAQRFTLSPRTVDTHVERVLSKLGVSSRTRAVATAIRLGLVSAA
jgi:LuxR family maltose regulon positive regulatory protein